MVINTAIHVNDVGAVDHLVAGEAARGELRHHGCHAGDHVAAALAKCAVVHRLDQLRIAIHQRHHRAQMIVQHEAGDGGAAGQFLHHNPGDVTPGLGDAALTDDFQIADGQGALGRDALALVHALIAAAVRAVPEAGAQLRAVAVPRLHDLPRLIGAAVGDAARRLRFVEILGVGLIAVRVVAKTRMIQPDHRMRALAAIAIAAAGQDRQAATRQPAIAVPLRRARNQLADVAELVVALCTADRAAVRAVLDAADARVTRLGEPIELVVGEQLAVLPGLVARQQVAGRPNQAMARLSAASSATPGAGG